MKKTIRLIMCTAIILSMTVIADAEKGGSLGIDINDPYYSSAKPDGGFTQREVFDNGERRVVVSGFENGLVGEISEEENKYAAEKAAAVSEIQKFCERYREDGSISNEDYARLRELLNEFYPDASVEDYLPGAEDSYQPITSAWASADVQAAISEGLVPAYLQYKFTRPMTRGEFCALAVSLYEKIKGAEITQRVTFSDTFLDYVEKAAGVGIVNGVGGGKFAPENPLTREQAAAMLVRLASALDRPLGASAPETEFSDLSAVSSWALEAVGQVQASGILNGAGGAFQPKGNYTKEQSIVTILRLYQLLAA